MSRGPKAKTIALEDRTFIFARRVREFAKGLPVEVAPAELVKKLLRSSGAVDSSCVEANEALCKEDYFMRLKLARNEANKTDNCLKGLDLSNFKKLDKWRRPFLTEAEELSRIFTSVLEEGDNEPWPPIEDI